MTTIKKLNQKEVDKRMKKPKKINTDFYDNLPGTVCEVVERLKERYSQKPWFRKAWEEYRNHVNSTSMDDVRKPGFVFNKYLKTKAT